MSTIKSSAENLTLNADGANNDIIFQSNGTTKATLDQAGLLTATTFAGSGASLTALPAAQLTGALPAISGASLTGIHADVNVNTDGWLRVAPTTDQNSAAVIDFATSLHLGSNVTESGGRITVGTAGWYLVSFHISNQSAFSDNMSMQLRKGGSTQLGRLYWEGNTEINYMGMDATVLIQCSANDILDVYGTGYFSGNTNSDSLTWFSGVRIGTN